MPEEDGPLACSVSRPRINSSEIKELASGSPVEQESKSRLHKGSLKMRQPNFNEASCDSSGTTESLKTGVDLEGLKTRPLQLRRENPEEAQWSLEEDLFGNAELRVEEVSK